MPVKRINRNIKKRGKRREPPMRARAVADYIGTSLSWVNKRTMTDEARERNGIREALPHYYLGGILVFDREEIEQWLERQPRRRRKRTSPTIFAALEHIAEEPR